MVKFAPIISVLNYLKKTFQLTNEMDLKTKEYLKIGYQRQLTYRHNDGSYSAFGPNSSKESGGTWLTAFVLRCFSDAYKLNQIKIDENEIKKSLNMLLNIQNEDGSFDQVGSPLLSKALAGGLSNKKIGLSAYVIISVLKAVDALGLKDSQYEKEKLNKGLLYLKNSLRSVEELDTYTLAITLYVFKLANYDEITSIEDLLSELDSRAVNESSREYFNQN
jgi:CD109 antigen